MKLRFLPAILATLTLSAPALIFTARAQDEPISLDVPVPMDAAPMDAVPMDAATSDATVPISETVTVWRDNSRQRDVPAKIFAPKTGGPFPLIVLSHGLGGSRDGLDYIGQFWAARGYVCAQIQHIGSDDAVWRGAKDEAEASARLGRAGANLTNILNRPRDVRFAIDQMLKLNADEKSELNGTMDATKIGVAGHSLGGLTALFSAGQKAISSGFALDLSDPRIKASISMSSPLNPSAPLSEQFADFATPNFYLVGSEDNAVLGATIAQRQVYDAIKAPEQYLLIIKGADHMALGGQRFGDDLPTDAADHALVQRATLAFLDAELKGNAAAKSWLKGGFAAQLGAAGTFASK